MSLEFRIQVAVFIYLLTTIVSVGHALILKKDSRSSVIWIILSVIFPFIGPLAYYIFGINRVERIARKLNHNTSRTNERFSYLIPTSEQKKLIEYHQNFVKITNLIENRPLLYGNKVKLLRNGEQAYPAMLGAINDAQTQIFLSTYIFDNGDTGHEFADALCDAHDRGVDVYVLIDGVGILYTLPSIMRKLKNKGINCERFMPLRLFPPCFSLNLRNHRKILVVDGCIAFAGGMNISDRHLSNDDRQRKVSDMHFQFKGPIVSQLYDLFCKDWAMTNREIPKTLPEMKFDHSLLSMPCRVIADGPDEDLNKLSLILHSAICAAKKSVVIMTPYFIPSREMIAIILAAVNRGIEITIVLPEKSNLPFVDAATRNLLWELLEWNIKVYYQPAPFEHAKLIVIDDFYVMVGSANIDPRSLRLNFELMVEILDQKFAQQMVGQLQDILRISRQVTFHEVEQRSLMARIKDSFFWLFSPYL